MALQHRSISLEAQPLRTESEPPEVRATEPGRRDPSEPAHRARAATVRAATSTRLFATALELVKSLVDHPGRNWGFVLAARSPRASHPKLRRTCAEPVLAALSSVLSPARPGATRLSSPQAEGIVKKAA